MSYAVVAFAFQLLGDGVLLLSFVDELFDGLVKGGTGSVDVVFGGELHDLQPED